MQPAWSVIMFTSATGAGQGIVVTLVLAEVFGRLGIWPEQLGGLYVAISVFAFGLMFFGLASSFFHLGRPERAWRSVSQWRTSWLSREVILLPILMVLTLIYALLHLLAGDGVSSTTGTLGAAVALMCAAIVLYVCTGMIYACIRFIPQWSSPLTVVNYAMSGIASGAIFTTALGYLLGSSAVSQYSQVAFLLTAVAMLTRVLQMVGNLRTTHKVSLRSAIGIHHRHIKQLARGFEAPAFNTKEFNHGVSAPVFEGVRYLALTLAFVIPMGLLYFAERYALSQLFVYAAAVHGLGVLMDRWFFFADATHVQNLYYQVDLR